MKNVSVVVFARQQLVLNHLYQENKKSIVPAAMRRNMQPGVLNVKRYVDCFN